MINDQVLARFEPFGQGLLKPIYQDYGFANLPATLHFLLTGERLGRLLPPDCFGGSYPTPKRIILLFIDSFGWDCWQRYAERSTVMRRVIRDGVLTPISALFPSTTSASVSTLNLGSLPAAHGVFEWNLYIPSIGETIQTLPFSTLGKTAVSCTTMGYDADLLVARQETTHQRLARQGVRSIQLAHRNHAFSPYNKIVSAGAEVIPHGTLPEALIQLQDLMADPPEKALINLYWAGLDSAAHALGPRSAVHEAETRSFWLTMDAFLGEIRSPDTMLLITADHGQVKGKADQTLYINEIYPELEDCLLRSPSGQIILPNGSPRDMFLHIEPDRREHVLGLLRDGLSDVAMVIAVDEPIDLGLFGARSIGPQNRQRLGDVLLLPYGGHFVWWRKDGILENRFNGHHGGLVAEELITVAGVLNQL
ncbi:MAG: alkaline phosphatase family protein [Pseudomonadota bacterium]